MLNISHECLVISKHEASLKTIGSPSNMTNSLDDFGVKLQLTWKAPAHLGSRRPSWSKCLAGSFGTWGEIFQRVKTRLRSKIMMLQTWLKYSKVNVGNGNPDQTHWMLLVIDFNLFDGKTIQRYVAPKQLRLEWLGNDRWKEWGWLVWEWFSRYMLS